MMVQLWVERLTWISWSILNQTGPYHSQLTNVYYSTLFNAFQSFDKSFPLQFLSIVYASTTYFFNCTSIDRLFDHLLAFSPTRNSPTFGLWRRTWGPGTFLPTWGRTVCFRSFHVKIFPMLLVLGFSTRVHLNRPHNFKLWVEREKERQSPTF